MELYDYQRKSVDWLHSCRPTNREWNAPYNVGLIGHECGLGKTAIGLAAIKPEIEKGKKFLILAPGATTIQWQKNWNEWILNGEPDEWGIDGLHRVSGSKSLIPRGMSVVMSHNLLAKKKIVERLIAENYDGIIIDEIHKFGAISSKRLTHLRALTNLTESKFAAARIGLTGTPIRNYAREIYNVCHFLAPERWRNYEEFSRLYLTFDRKSLYNPAGFHRDFGPYYLRYEYKQVKRDLPEIRRTKLYCEITDKFVIDAYNRELDLFENFVESAPVVGANSLLGFLVKLRHITGIAKARSAAITDPIRDFLETGQRAVIGIHHHLVYDFLSKALAGFPQILIRGGMDVSEKARKIEEFRNSPPNTVLFLSIKAAGEGIDGLQYAAHKIYTFERMWNGSDEHQYEARVYRTGQEWPVESEITIATGTVDEYFDEMIVSKNRNCAQVESENWENDPIFLRDLCRKVIANRLPTNPAAEYDLLDATEDLED